MALPLVPMAPRSGLRGMVAAADQLASSAGIGVLARGGSAADAAVATGAAMAVVGPHLCGLGGDVLAMVAAPGSPPKALLSVGRAGRGSDAAAMRAEGMTVMPLRGDIRSVQVPGALDGWLTLHERYGRLPLADVVAPAVELADDGFPASIMLALASHLVHALPGAGELCPDGPLRIGQRVRVPGIARTLRAVGRDGRSAFYQGEFGRGLLELGAGHFHPEDFASSAATWCAPLHLSCGITTSGPSHRPHRATSLWLGHSSPRPPVSARTPTTPSGPTSWSNRGGQSGSTDPRSSTTEPTETHSSTGTASTRQPSGSTAGPRRRPTSRQDATRAEETWHA